MEFEASSSSAMLSLRADTALLNFTLPAWSGAVKDGLNHGFNEPI